jgi:hypothetical protein
MMRSRERSAAHTELPMRVTEEPRKRKDMHEKKAEGSKKPLTLQGECLVSIHGTGGYSEKWNSTQQHSTV